MSKKWIYFCSLFYSYMVFGSVAISFRCACLRGIECLLLQKNISDFAEATREKRFTTMTPLGMSRDVTCHRLWRHNCFSNSIQFELIYFISIWTSQNFYFSLYQKKKTNFSITPRVCRDITVNTNFYFSHYYKSTATVSCHSNQSSYHIGTKTYSFPLPIL